MRDVAETAAEAKSYGLAVVIWSYPRGGNGSIIGCNTFQRSKKDAIDMLSKIVKIYQGKD
jgi:DhnA family fructose-bisphosphate aldolase class Ia